MRIPCNLFVAGGAGLLPYELSRRGRGLTGFRASGLAPFDGAAVAGGKRSHSRAKASKMPSNPGLRPGAAIIEQSHFWPIFMHQVPPWELSWQAFGTEFAICGPVILARNVMSRLWYIPERRLHSVRSITSWAASYPACR